jgi:hypothetical protein
MKFLCELYGVYGYSVAPVSERNVLIKAMNTMATRVSLNMTVHLFFFSESRVRNFLQK